MLHRWIFFLLLASGFWLLASGFWLLTSYFFFNNCLSTYGRIPPLR
jgi:hypothetical protein